MSPPQDALAALATALGAGPIRADSARADPIVADSDLPMSEWIDRGGANNLICPEPTISRNATGQVASGFLVEVKKVNIDELKAKYPEAFPRDYDPASGLRFSGWVEGGQL